MHSSTVRVSGNHRY